MKKILLFLPFILLFSCTVQKRKYQSGYYVSWNNKNSKNEKSLVLHSKATRSVAKEKSNEEAQIPSNVNENRETVLSAGSSFHALNFNKRQRVAPPEDTCDVLVFKDGSEIRGKVKEVTGTEIKYKRCDTPDGPTYISKNSDLFMIKYANGTREVIKSEAPPQQLKIPEKNFNSYKQSTFRKQTHPMAIASLIFGVLSLIIAYVLLFALLIGALYSTGFLLLPFFVALTAVITGKTAINRIREQPDVYKGKGMAIPGSIMGLIIVGIYALIAFIFILVLAGI